MAFCHENIALYRGRQKRSKLVIYHRKEALKIFIGWKDFNNNIRNVLRLNQRLGNIHKMLQNFDVAYGYYQRWSPRGRPWPRGRPRGHIFKSLALASNPQVLGLGLGLEPSSPRKLPCPRLEDSTIFCSVENAKNLAENSENFVFCHWRSPEKVFIIIINGQRCK